MYFSFSKKVSPEQAFAELDLLKARPQRGLLGFGNVSLLLPNTMQTENHVLAISFKAHSVVLARILEYASFRISNNYYVLLPVVFEGDHKPRRIYLEVNHAVSQLLSSEEKLRNSIEDLSYWRSRIVTITDAVELVYQSLKNNSKRTIYSNVVAAYKEALKKDISLKKTNCFIVKVGFVSIWKNSEGSLEPIYEISCMGQGGFGSVFQICSFVNVKLTALKKAHETKRGEGVNKVALALMNHQKVNSEKTSNLLKINRIIERDSSYDEEYELAVSDIGSKIQTYNLEKKNKLFSSVICAIEEFQELGFLYLDLKPSNVLYSQNSEGQVLFKLGDFDETSPCIKDIEGFKLWAKSSRYISHTKQYYIEKEFYVLIVLKLLAKTMISSDFEKIKTVFEGVDPIIRKFIDPECFFSLKSLGEQEMQEEFIELVFSLFKEKGESIVVFQLGVFFCFCLTFSFPYQSFGVARDYCQVVLGGVEVIKQNLESFNPKNQKINEMILSMLDPDPALRPRFSKVKDFFMI